MAKGIPAIYTHPNYEDRQLLLELARPDNIILTNLAAGEQVLQAMRKSLQKYWLRDDSVIFQHHQRGADELPHSGLKDFGSEELPCKHFASNQTYYYLIVIAFFTFKGDVLKDVLPVRGYATTMRPQLLDIAAKIVHTGNMISESDARGHGPSAIPKTLDLLSESHLNSACDLIALDD